jgi:transcriptional regulator with XRE-family HTH domain
MSIVEYGLTQAATPVPLGPPTAENRSLHRLRSVRRSEGVSRRAMARRLNTDVQSVAQEEESADLPLSTLYRWQAALDVPIEELLIEHGPELSAPVRKRSQMLRLMKTAASIIEQAKQLAIRRMGQNLVDQILEIMPELEGVGPWPLVGQRRNLNDLGQAARRFFCTGSHSGLDDQNVA